MKFLALNWRALIGASNFGTRTLLQSSKCLTSHQKTFVVVVEGNIASGKSETLKYFSRFNEMTIVNEPIDRWRNVESSGLNLFQKFYSDPKRWCMPFQSYVQITMLQTHFKCLNKPLTMMERSLFSARHCFVENLHRKGIMTEVEYQILDAWYRQLATMLHIDLVLYLRIDPSVCLERIRQRGREEETTISLDYLRDLHDLHEEWLIDPKHPHLSKTQVRVIEGDRSLSEMHRILEQEMDSILNTARALA